MAARAADKGITYVAFTATPKGKTLELFGRVPDPTQPASQTNVPEPFHVYSMRQAIEEGFILDVLQNYTPYSLAFKLASGGEELDDTEVERSEAVKSLMRWVRLHDYNISQKVAVVVEHYRSTVQPLLDGKAKAMVVVGSRIEAVRWQLAISSIAERRRRGLASPRIRHERCAGLHASNTSARILRKQQRKVPMHTHAESNCIRMQNGSTLHPCRA